LNVSIRYSPEAAADLPIDKLKEAFELELYKIADYVDSCDEILIIPSDYPQADIGRQDLHFVLNNLIRT